MKTADGTMTEATITAGEEGGITQTNAEAVTVTIMDMVMARLTVITLTE